MANAKQTYRYRPQQEYIRKPWYRELLSRIEKANKIVTLRILGKYLRVRHLDGPLGLDKVSSVLIIRYDALGDMIVTTPLWRILKRVKPEIKIGVAGSYKNLDLLRADPDIDVRYDYTASSLGDFRNLSKKTREETWDLVLMCNFNQKTRNSIVSSLATTNGYTATVGLANVEGHQALFSRLVSLPKTKRPLLMTQQLQYLLRSVLILPDAPYERPSIVIDPEADRSTHQRINTMLEATGCSKYMIINTDAPTFKKWGLANNFALARHIAMMHPEYLIVLTALPENGKEIVSALTSSELPNIKYFETSDIHEMCSLIRYCSLVVTPDTSIVHLASAESKPVVAFYLAAGEWLPFGIAAEILLPAKSDAIATIPFTLVRDAVDRMLDSLRRSTPIQQRITWSDRPDDFQVIPVELSADRAVQA